MTYIKASNLRMSVRSALARWVAPTKFAPPPPVAPPPPQEPAHVPLVDGIHVGNEQINSLTLRGLDISDEPSIAKMKPDVPDVLRLVERLSDVSFQDLQLLTQDDFAVLAQAVEAHFRAFDKHLKESIRANGHSN